MGVRTEALLLPQTSDAGKHMRAGLEAVHRRDLVTARAELAAAAQAAPQEPAPLLALADVALRSGSADEARVLLQQAEKIAPRSVLVYTALSHLLVQRKDFIGAVDAIDKAIALDPKSPALHVTKGEVYALGLRDGAKAQAEFRAAIALDASDASAHYALGLSLEQAGRYREATAELQRAADLNPGYATGWVALGSAQTGAGDRAAALASYDRALKISPALWTAHTGRGDIFESEGRYDDAIAAYQEALKGNPRAAWLLARLGAVEAMAKRPADAEKHYRAALSIEPRQPVAMNNLAFLLADQKRNLDEALELAQKSLESLPPSADYAWDTLAWVRRARGELTEAAKILEPIAAHAKSPAMVYHLGVVYADMGRKDDAAAMFDKALRLAPNYAPAAEAKKRLAAG
jgi:tetratricopeptide (TPR) repeat protein